jgi:hypothetical protein
MSDGGVPYRAKPAGARDLSFRYVPFEWYAPLVLGIFAGLFGWVIANDRPDKLLMHGAIYVVFLALVGARSFPVVRVHASFTAGEVVVRGCRWPGAETVWSCDTEEAVGFEVEVLEGRRGRRFRRLALKTVGGRLLPLTETAWPGGSWLYTKRLARLNAWLNDVRSGRGHDRPIVR